MLLFKLKNHLACQLCGTVRANQNSVCSFCWQQLPWQKQQIIRHEIECFVCCSYTFPISRIIHQFKEQTQLQFLELLTACLSTSMTKPQNVQAIVPMPISNEKLIQRGFHHTFLLAQALSKIWHIPVWQPISRHDGKKQRGLSREERLSNLNHLFYPNTTQCLYTQVLILDDVVTTGASLSALQLQLKHLGCEDILALCLCDAKH